jgi:hypothetical protein
VVLGFCVVVGFLLVECFLEKLQFYKILNGFEQFSKFNTVFEQFLI